MKSILLIEDSPVIMSCYKLFLSKTYRLSTAVDLQAAITHMQKETFDLVISDWCFPGSKDESSGGGDLLQHLQATKAKIRLCFNTATPERVFDARNYPDVKFSVLDKRVHFKAQQQQAFLNEVERIIMAGSNGESNV